MARPRLFVGSSAERIPIAYAVQENFYRDFEVTVWDQGAFALSRTTIEGLVDQLDRADAAVFVLSPDDVAIIRGDRVSAVRDNVIFELGLFIGRLGRERTFLLVPQSSSDLHLPSDLAGVTAATYEIGRSDDNWQAALGPACNRIRRAVKAADAVASSSRAVRPAVTAPTATAQAAEALTASDPAVRDSGVRALSQMDNPEAADALANALKSPFPAVRSAAALDLARRGDPRAEDILIHLLSDRSRHQLDIQLALGKLPPKTRAAVLARAVSVAPENVLAYLRNANDIAEVIPSIASALLPLITHGKADVRAAVSIMLREAGPTLEAIPYLTEALHDERVFHGFPIHSKFGPRVCDQAATTIKGMGLEHLLPQPALELFQRRITELKGRGARELGGLTLA